MYEIIWSGEIDVTKSLGILKYQVDIPVKFYQTAAHVDLIFRGKMADMLWGI